MSDEAEPVVLSTWVLRSGRRMPELPEKVAIKALALIQREIRWEHLSYAEKREALGMITAQMVCELAYKSPQFTEQEGACGEKFGLPDTCEFPSGHTGPHGFLREEP